MQEVINFYSSKAEYGFMSNFANYSVSIDGKTYRSTEHFYQSQKYQGTRWETEVRNAKSPMDAATIGRDKDGPLRDDWESVKDNVMRRAVEAKFRQHPELAKQLLATGEAKLVEHTEKDFYWADGGNGTGKNMLGVILMEVRAKLRKEDEIRVAANNSGEIDPVC